MTGRKTRGGQFRRGEPGYDAALMGGLFNQRHPNRYPAIVVQANSTEEVIAAIHQARREGLKIGICSGGHGWSQSHVRDGGMVLDVSRLNSFSIDTTAMRAVAGPGVGGSQLAIAAGRQGLFFPSGHCKGVAIGGYLLQGGFGWHSRAIGVACESVLGLDIVTAEGRLVHASETENPGLYWAARGSGCGFFGVVVQFHLRLRQRPAIIGIASQIFRMRHFDEVLRWAHGVGETVGPEVEFQLVFSRRAGLIWAPGLEVIAPVIAETKAQAARALEFFNDSPIRKYASVALPMLRLGLGPMYSLVMKHYPEGRRWGVDNMWTHAPIEKLLPGLRRMADTMPPAPSHVLWLNWMPQTPRPDMAFSLEDKTYIAAYGNWKHAEDDTKYANWAHDRIAEMAAFSTGVQLADENLGGNPKPFAQDANMQRLAELRAAHDPGGMFHRWMGR